MKGKIFILIFTILFFLSLVSSSTNFLGYYNGANLTNFTGDGTTTPYSSTWGNCNEGDVGTWDYVQATCDRNGGFNTQNNKTHAFAPTQHAGSTWTVGNPADAGVMVINLNQTRTFNQLVVFQMFSDGKVTHVQLFENSSVPGNWTQVIPKTSVGPGNGYSVSGGYIVTNATNISFSDTTAKHIMLKFWNNGSYGNSGYIEVFSVKLFGDASMTIDFTSPTPETGIYTGNSIYANISSTNSNEHYVVNNFNNSILFWLRGEGNANDELGVRNASVSGTTYSSGKYNQTFFLDGVNDYINSADNLMTSPGMICTWFKTNASSGVIYGVQNVDAGGIPGWYVPVLYFNGSRLYGEYGWYGSCNQAASSSALTDNNWHHVCLGYNGSYDFLYVDGVLNSSRSVSTSFNTYQQIGVGYTTGCWGLSGWVYFNGSLDEILFFNKTLSLSEVKALYNASANQYYNNFTNLSLGTYSFKGYSIDVFGNKNETETRTIILSSDVIHPIFSSYGDNNGSLGDSGVARFNVTITNTNGTVWLNINGTNVTAGNLSANIYNATYSLGASGNYNYTWWAYGNSSSHWINSSVVRNYTVNASYPIFSGLTLSPSNGTNYSVNANYGFTVTLVRTNGTAGIEFNGTNYTMLNTSFTSYNRSFANLKAGTYTYYFWSFGSGTSKLFNKTQTYSYTVSKAQGVVNGTINHSQRNFTAFSGSASQNIYINATNKTGIGTGKIYLNGSLINSGNFSLFNITNFSIGYYNITFVYDGNENYSSQSRSLFANITQEDTIYPVFSSYGDNNGTLYINGTATFNVSVTNTNGTVLLKLNNTNYAATNLTGNVYNVSLFLSNGTYLYNWSAYGNGTSKNLNTSVNRNYTVINRDGNYPRFSVYGDNNGSLNNSGTGVFNVTIANTNGSVVLEINGVNISAYNLSANVYNATYSFSTNGSYSYKWHAFGDGRDNLFNSSILKNYFIRYSCASNLTNTTPSAWQNQGVCKIDDLQLQNRSKVQYDSNVCIGVNNQTLWDYQNISCNYCSYNVVNSSWREWTNVSCLISNLMNQTRSRIQYDFNYGECYAVTGLESDLWNSGDNITHYEYRLTEACTYNEAVVVVLTSPDDNYFADNSSLVNITFNCSVQTISNLSNVSLFLTNNQNNSFILNRTTEITGTNNLSNWTLELNGNYTWNCFGADIYGNTSFANANRSIRIGFIDDDKDGVRNNEDKLEWNESNVNASGINNLNISIGGNSTTGSFDDVQEIIFYDSSTPIINFTHNFTASELDLKKVSVIKSANSIIVNLSGQLQESYNKTLYITDNNFIGLCVKDAEIASLSDISSSCTGGNETDFTSCLNSNITINGTECIDNGTIIIVNNLRYSGIKGTPYTAPAGGSDTGGGGGGGSSKSYLFLVEPEKINLRIRQGENSEFEIKVKNNNPHSVTIKLQESLGEFISLNQTSYEILSKKEEVIKFDVFVSNDTTPKTYLGNIKIDSQDTSKKVDILLDVIPSEGMFDVIVKLEKGYEHVLAGKEIKFNVQLLKLLDAASEDVKIRYNILNEKKEVVLTSSDTRAIETTLEYIKEFVIPINFETGNYVLETSVDYAGETAVSEIPFSVVSEEELSSLKDYSWITVIVVLVLAFGFLYIAKNIRVRRKVTLEEVEKLIEEHNKEEIVLNSDEKNVLTLLDGAEIRSAIRIIESYVYLPEEDIFRIIEKLHNKELVEIVRIREGEMETQKYVHTEKVKPNMLNDDLRFKKDMGWDYR